MEFCDCRDWLSIEQSNPEIFKLYDSYGWVLSWVELTKEPGYTKINQYAVKISFCPFCGKNL